LPVKEAMNQWESMRKVQFSFSTVELFLRLDLVADCPRGFLSKERRKMMRNPCVV
jgi:hypothetical protein